MQKEQVPPWSWFGHLPRNWQVFCALLFIFGVVVNLVSYAIVFQIIGGCAENGKIEDGKYYVRDRGGSFTEVSKTVFYYSHIHGIYGHILAVLILVPLIIIDRRFRINT